MSILYRIIAIIKTRDVFISKRSKDSAYMSYNQSSIGPKNVVKAEES